MNEYKLLHCNDEESLRKMHEIREKVLFPSGNYDRHHPDDINPDHHCFIFLLNKTAVGTVRLDFLNPQEAAVRLVAILPEYQSQKAGSKMLNAIEDYAKQQGVNKLVTNAAIDAKKFYEAIGFIPEDWIDPGERISQPTIPMVKHLVPSNEGLKYDLIASGFANMRDAFYKEKKYLDLFLGYLQPGNHVLDVGCGSGHPIASYLIKHGLRVTGIDASKKLLEIAKVKCPSMNTIYGDIRTVPLTESFDGIIEWWCLFHVPKQDHEKMISRFAGWLKKGGILEFTTGDKEFEDSSSAMLNQELKFYSLDPSYYEKYLEKNGFKILLREHDQEQHLVWIAKFDPITIDYTQLTLIADRIKLIPISMDYTHDLCRHFTAEITKYMWPSAPKKHEEINKHILLKQNEMKKGEEISLIIINKKNDDFLGYISVHQVHSKTPELGIWLKKEAHGQQYGYEALILLISWAEKNLEYNYLKYPVDKANTPSRKLAEKLGGNVEDEYIKTSESGNVLDEVEYRFYKTV